MYSSSTASPSSWAPPQPPTFSSQVEDAGIPPVNAADEITHGPSPPATVNTLSRSPVPWSTGLCDCCDDVHTCCLTLWCPCVTFGRIAEIVDRGSTSCGASGALYTLIMCVCGCSCLYSCFYRSKLRGQYFLNEGPCTDCCVHWCCEGCALCQEYRELKNRGFDMSIGWHGNMERQKRGVEILAPPVQGGMTR